MDNVRMLPGLREDAEVATHEIGKLFQNLRPPFIAAREARTAAQAPRAVILCLVVLSLGVTIPALGQDQTAAPKDTAASEEDQAEPAYLALRCPSPANPYQRHHDCVRKSFDSLKETLTQELYLQESLFNGNLTVAAGRLAPGNTFATIPVLGNYLNGGINGNPGSIPTNDGIFTASPPGVEWGGQLTFNFTPTFQFATGIFNTNPNAAAGADNGVNFSLQQGN
jgi:hypothetical protein